MPKFTTYLQPEHVKYLREKSFEETQAGKYTSAANIIQRLIDADMQKNQENKKIIAKISK